MKVKVYYYPVRVKSKPRKLKRVPVRESGVEACGKWITSRKIRASKHLTRKEKQLLLDMCDGVSVRREKQIKRKPNGRAVAKYWVNGTIFSDGGIMEYSGFNRI